MNAQLNKQDGFTGRSIIGRELKQKDTVEGLLKIQW